MNSHSPVHGHRAREHQVKAASGSAALIAESLGVSYGRTRALDNVNFVIQKGELVGVVGPNGAGKSSLFRALAGFVPHDGEVFLDGVCCHHRQRTSIAFIPQRNDIDLDFPISVEQLVVSGRRRFRSWYGRPTAEDRAAAKRALAQVDLAGIGSQSLGTLSGGQAQRAFLARALAQNAEIVLLDESLSGVDVPTTVELFALFHQLVDDGVTMLLATHDLALARNEFDRCIAINTTVCADGVPSDVLNVETLDSVFGSRPNRMASEGSS